MSGAWSDELRVIQDPVATYQTLVRQPAAPGRWARMRRPLFTVFVIGAFVSLTTTGRLVVPFVVDGMLWWSFVPALQIILLTLVITVFGRSTLQLSRSIDLFFAGHGPLWLWLLGISGVCLFVPVPHVDALLSYSAPSFLASVIAGVVWSIVTTFGFFRGALDLSRTRATLATLTYSIALWGTLISYLFAVEMLQRGRLRF